MKPFNLKVILYNIKSFSFLIFLGVLSIGCKKEWLEVKPNLSLAVPSTAKDFQAMLDNDGQINAFNPILNEIAADGHYITEAYWTSLKSIPSQAPIPNAYTWSNNVYFNGNVLEDWNRPYTAILLMNIILDESSKIKDGSSEINNIRGQALFNRSYRFFNLAQTYCPPYNESTANLNLGIPLRTTTDVTLPATRPTVQQTYDQIIKDLMEAKELVAVSPEYVTRASKAAVLALLAKTYLVMRDYEKARFYADQCLQIKSSLLTYNSISSSATFIGVNQEVIFFTYMGGSIVTTQYFIDQLLYDSYSPNDLRKNLFFNVSSSGISFKGSYSNRTQDVFSGLAVDEVYLIRAECEARRGNISAAMKDLNDLLRTRWAKNPDGTTKYVDQTASDVNSAINKILMERRKQLILRNVRWSDLRRLNQEEQFKTTISRTIGGETYVLEPGSFRYTFPLPNNFLQQTGVEQNPGW